MIEVLMRCGKDQSTSTHMCLSFTKVSTRFLELPWLLNTMVTPSGGWNFNNAPLLVGNNDITASTSLNPTRLFYSKLILLPESGSRKALQIK